jgi:transcriptional regulator with XRE-family HTH domain
MRAPTRRLSPVPGGTAGKTRTMQMELDAFADRLQQRRKEFGYSQSDLAREVWGEITLKNGKKAAKNRDRISTYEMGKSWPDPHNLALIAKALDIAPEDLAPNIAASTVARQNPALSIVQIEGHDDKVLLQVNMLVTRAVATEIMILLNRDSMLSDHSQSITKETSMAMAAALGRLPKSDT